MEEGPRFNLSPAEDDSIGEDFYSCKTTISVDDLDGQSPQYEAALDGLYVSDEEDDGHQAAITSTGETPESIGVEDGRKYKVEMEEVTDEES